MSEQTINRTWTSIKEYSDIRFEYFEGIAKITINRPEVHNAFRPQTLPRNHTDKNYRIGVTRELLAENAAT